MFNSIRLHKLLVVSFSQILLFINIVSAVPQNSSDSLFETANYDVYNLQDAIEIEKLISQLSTRQKIGQRFITYVKGTTIDQGTANLIQNGFVGGVIINQNNLYSYDQAKLLAKNLQELTENNNPPIELFIVADQEGGRVDRYRFREVTKFPPPYYWAKDNDEEFVEAAAYITSKELLRLGVNMNLAPVLDVYSVADNSIIGDRSFGGDFDLVAKMGIAYLKGSFRAGIISVVKHFPGHGFSVVDSHQSLPEVNLNKEELAYLLSPFRDAVEYGVPAVMTAHILYPQLDPEAPATLSVPILQGLLRDDLGFQGIVISDAIEMRALSDKYGPVDIVKKAIEAGVDLVLINSYHDTFAIQESILEFFNSGEITEEDINIGLRRILRIKHQYGLLKNYNIK